MSILAKNVLWTFLGQILPSLATLIAIPFILKGLTPVRFGILLTLLSILAYAGLLANGFVLSLTQSLSENQGRQKQETKELSAVIVRTSLMILLLLGLSTSIAMILFQETLIKRFLNIPIYLQSETTSALQILALIIPLAVFNAGLRGILYAYQSFKIASLIQTQLGVLTALSPLFLLPFSHSLIPIFSLLLIFQFIALAYLWVEAKKFVPQINSTIALNISSIKATLQFGGWLSVSSIVGPLMLYSDRFVIGSLISMSAVTFYATPYDLVTKLWIIPAAVCAPFFTIASMTYLSNIEKTKKIYLKSLKFVFIALSPFILILTTFAKEGLRLWINPEFSANAYRIAQLIAVGVLINSFAQVSLHMIIALKRPDIPGKLHFIEFPLYIIILYFFVTYWGIVGAALAWILRIIIDTIIIFILLIRMLKIPARHIYNKFYLYFTISIIFGIPFILITLFQKILFVSLSLIWIAGFSWQFLLENEDKVWLLHTLKLKEN